MTDAGALNGADFLFTFHEATLGVLPTHVGIVATDLCNRDTIFKVFGPGVVLLNPNTPDNTFQIAFGRPGWATARVYPTHSPGRPHQVDGRARP